MIIPKGWWLWIIAMFVSIIMFFVLFFIHRTVFKRKRISLIILLMVFLLGVGLLVWAVLEIRDISTPMSLQSTNQGVEIFTDKEIYSKGELVKVMVEKMGNKKLYTGTGFSFYEDNLLIYESSGLNFYKLEDDVLFSDETAKERKNWGKVIQSPCGCYRQCVDGEIVDFCRKISPLMPALECKPIPQGTTLEEWLQEECVRETRWCGDETYETSALKQAKAGTYKVRLCFAGESDIDWSKDYCSSKEVVFGPGDVKPHCIETIFIIE